MIISKIKKNPGIECWKKGERRGGNGERARQRKRRGEGENEGGSNTEGKTDCKVGERERI